jgi:hypothetical protein
VRCGHRRQRFGQGADRAAEQAGQPEAADAGEGDAEHPDQRQAPHRVAHGGSRRFVNRPEGVEHRVADGDEPPEGIRLAIEGQRAVNRFRDGDRRLELPCGALGQRGRQNQTVGDDRDAMADEALEFFGVLLVQTGRDVQGADRRLIKQERHRHDTEVAVTHPRHPIEPVDRLGSVIRDERHRPAPRPAIGHRPRRREGDLTRVHEHDRVRVDACGDFLENQVDGFEQIGAEERGVGAGFRLIRVERRLERRVVGQRLGLRAQLALAAGLHRRKHPLRRVEVRGDRLANLIAHAEGDDDEHHAEQQRHGREGDGHRLHEQTRRTAVAHRVVAPMGTGTVSSIAVVWPASTRMGCARSPTRSCQPMIV